MAIFTPGFAFTLDASIVDVEFNCDAGLAVGDVVYHSDTTDSTVVKVNGVTYPGLIIGTCVLKPTDTTCTIRIVGLIEGQATGLTAGKKIFSDGAGGVTSTVPGAGEHFQCLGVATSATDYLLIPHGNKVVRSA